MTFDLWNWYGNNQKIQIFEDLTKDDLSLYRWKYLFTVDVHLLKISFISYIVEKFLFSNWIFDLFQTDFSKNEKIRVSGAPIFIFLFYFLRHDQA